jgi:hypothetical protein
LPADLVEVDERQPAFRDPRDRDAEPLVGLAAPIGRAVRHEQDLAAGLGDALDDLVAPNVLADRDADAETANHHRAGQRPRLEHPLLVENAVVRQVDLEAHRVDGAFVQQRVGIVEKAPFHPGQPDQHRGAAIGGLARQPLARFAAGVLERRLQNQILRRITAKEELGEHDDIGAQPRGFGPPLTHPGSVPRHVAHRWVELGQRDLEGTGHQAGLTRGRQGGNAAMPKLGRGTSPHRDRCLRQKRETRP